MLALSSVFLLESRVGFKAKTDSSGSMADMDSGDFSHTLIVQVNVLKILARFDFSFQLRVHRFLGGCKFRGQESTDSCTSVFFDQHFSSCSIVLIQ